MEDNLEWTLQHPISRVIWVPSEYVHANDYNPNAVAPPELELLYVSIISDGITQPIVAWKIGDDNYEVIDGFHRYRICTERLNLSHLPLVIVNTDRTDRGDRIAATIRHNRARGKHQVNSMSDIVLELSRRNWSNKKIANELGMEPDEVLRLKQITGLAELFKHGEFFQAWEYSEEQAK